MDAHALLIVDMQAGFADGDPRVHDLAERIASHAQARRADFALIAASRFVSTPGSTYARLVGDDMQRPDEVALLEPIARVADYQFDSGSYASVTLGLVERLLELDVRTVHVCGIDTDQCVLATTFALFDAGLEPVALADLCLSTSGATCHDAGLVALRRAIGEDRVVSHLEAATR